MPNDLVSFRNRARASLRWARTPCVAHLPPYFMVNRFSEMLQPKGEKVASAVLSHTQPSG